MNTHFTHEEIEKLLKDAEVWQDGKVIGIEANSRIVIYVGSIIRQLLDENKQMREALKQYAYNPSFEDYSNDFGAKARQALAAVDGKKGE